MRECPRCGDLQNLDPGLYRKLVEERGHVTQGPDVYKISGGKVAYRIWRVLYKARGKSFSQVRGYFDGATLKTYWAWDAQHDLAQKSLEPYVGRGGAPTRAKSHGRRGSSSNKDGRRRAVSRRPGDPPRSSGLRPGNPDRKEGSRRT